MKLNLGCGKHELPGYVNLDGQKGDTIYPLSYSDGSVDEVRASHVLEHFSHAEVPSVLKEWCRVLKPGGTLKIAVPDFEDIARRYLSGQRIPVEGFVMGGQTDELDYHKSIFDTESLIALLRSVGLRDVANWKGEGDCSAYPISLNLQGVKRRPLTKQDVKDLKIGAAMSVPRLGFMDNFFCAFQSLAPLGIELRKHTGAFWGQCLERTMDEWIKEGKEWILTIDYDSVWTKQSVNDLFELARDSDADAIAPVQVHRTKKTPLMAMRGADGKNVSQAPRSVFQPDLTKVYAAHFGLTMIRVEALRDMPHPWFQGHPQEDGTWGPNRTDDDVYFWKQWDAHGKSLYLANHVCIGHAELMIRWPGEDFEAIYQHPTDFYRDGLPENIWK